MWIDVEGEHINLEVATSIVEVTTKDGKVGYKVFHGDGNRYTIVAIRKIPPLQHEKFARWRALDIVIKRIAQFLTVREA